MTKIKNRFLLLLALLIVVTGAFAPKITVYAEDADTTKPTLIAAVSDGLLTIEAKDEGSGVKTIYINNYEYDCPEDGKLSVRLQQFDAGYEYFTIYCVDNAKNVSSFYLVANPYFVSDEESTDENPAADLPISASATEPSSARGYVTDHIMTDESSNTIADSPQSVADQKKASLAEAELLSDGGEEQTNLTGREFYTIRTSGGRTFYLVIDRQGNDETVYFLTETSENDLLNTTSDNSETLSKNSAVAESAIPSDNNSTQNETSVESKPVTSDETAQEDASTTEPESETKEEAPAENTVVSYVLMGVLAVAAVAGGYYFKVVRPRKEKNFIEDEDEDMDEDFETEESEEETPKSIDDAFFDNADDADDADDYEIEQIKTSGNNDEIGE